MIWLHPASLRQPQLTLLARSMLAPPEFDRPAADVLIQRLHTGLAQAFGVGAGLLILEKRVGSNNTARICITAFAGIPPAHYRQLTHDLQQVALEWGCDTIETTVYDPRLARAMCRVGAEVESRNVVLRVEKADG